MSIEFLVDQRIPRHLSSLIFSFKPYDGQHKLIMEEITRARVEPWLKVFNKLWSDISGRNGISSIIMEIENEEEMDYMDIFTSESDSESYRDLISTNIGELVTFDYDELIEGLKLDKEVYEIPAITDIRLYYEAYIGNFEEFELDTREWELEDTCMCGNMKTYVRKNVPFVFRIRLFWTNSLARYTYYYPWCNC